MNMQKLLQWELYYVLIKSYRSNFAPFLLLSSCLTNIFKKSRWLMFYFEKLEYHLMWNDIWQSSGWKRILFNMHIFTTHVVWTRRSCVKRNAVFCLHQCPPPGETSVKTSHQQPLSWRLRQVLSLMGECKCVIYTCLVFYHDKAVHTPGKGEKRNASSSFIHRLSCFIHTPVILYHAPLSSCQEAEQHWNKSLIFCFLISFFLPVLSPISLFILYMWLPAC